MGKGLIMAKFVKSKDKGEPAPAVTGQVNMGKAALESAGLNDAQQTCIVPLSYSDEPGAQCKEREIKKKPAEDTSNGTFIGKELRKGLSMAKFVKSKDKGEPAPAVTGQ